MFAKMIDFQTHTDFRGELVVLEEKKEIPFKIERVYYIYNTPKGVVRGKHAHKKLEQILICIHGECKILLDDGDSKEVVCLNNPKKGLYIPNNIWREMYDFSSDAVLMVLASKLYDESDYIRSYDKFITFIKNNLKIGV